MMGFLYRLVFITLAVNDSTAVTSLGCQVLLWGAWQKKEKLGEKIILL